MSTLLHNKFAQTRRLWAAYRPLGALVWEHYRGKYVTTVLLAVGGVFAQAGLILVLVGGVRILNPEDPIRIFGMEAFLRENTLVTLVGIVALYVAMGWFSAWSTWRRDLLCRKIARLYQEAETSQRLQAVADAEVRPRDLPAKLVNPNMAFIQNPLVSSVALETTLQLVPPIVQMFGFSAALLILDWRLIFVAAPLLALPIPAFFVLNRVTHKASSRFYGKERQESRIRIINLLTEADMGTQSAGELGDAYASDKSIIATNDDYDRFKLAKQETAFLMANYRAMGIGLGLFGFGLAAVNGWLSWVTILGSVLALQRLQSAASLVFSHITSLIRFVSIVEERHEFIAGFSGTESGEDPIQRDAGRVAETHLFIADTVYGKILTSAVLNELRKVDRPISNPHFIGTQTAPPKDSRKLRQVLEKLNDARGDSGAGKLPESLTGDFPGLTDPDSWKELPSYWKTILAALSVTDLGKSSGTLLMQGGSDLIDRVANLRSLGFLTQVDALVFARRWSGNIPSVDRIWKVQSGRIVESGSASYWGEIGIIGSEADSDDADLALL